MIHNSHRLAKHIVKYIVEESETKYDIMENQDSLIGG